MARKSGHAVRLKNKHGPALSDEFVKNGFLFWGTWRGSTPRIKSIEILVKISCIQCQQEDFVNSKLLSKRVFDVEVCRRCSLRYVTNTLEWKESNSQAQLKIQGTAEQKLKNAAGVSKFWKEHPEHKELVRSKSILRHQDPVYKKKWTKAVKENPTFALGGEFLFRGGWIKFGSSYELCYLVWAENKNFIVRRCDYEIQYEFGGRTRVYWPDFVVVDEGKKTLVEIKSVKSRYYNPEKQAAKVLGVQKLLDAEVIDAYDVISELHPLSKEIVFRRSSGIFHLCKVLFQQNKIKLNNEKQRQLYIGTGKTRKCESKKLQPSPTSEKSSILPLETPTPTT